MRFDAGVLVGWRGLSSQLGYTSLHQAKQCASDDLVLCEVDDWVDDGTEVRQRRHEDCSWRVQCTTFEPRLLATQAITFCTRCT